MTAEYPEEGQSPWGEDLKDYIDAADTDTRNYVDTQVEDLLQPRDNDGNLRFINGDALSDGGAIVHEYVTGSGRQYAWKVSDDDLALSLVTRPNEDGTENPVAEFKLTGLGDKAALSASEIYAPRIGLSASRCLTSGTGSPEGVVTAAVGSRYTDTAATNGAVEWIKATGSGNTGWKVAYGDTGRRNVDALLENGATALDGVRLSRAGNMVELWLSVTSPSWTSAHRLMQIPSGFRPPETLYLPPPYATLTPAILLGYGDLHVYKGTPLGDRWLLHWRTEDAWPTSLPGSAV